MALSGIYVVLVIGVKVMPSNQSYLVNMGLRYTMTSRSFLIIIMAMDIMIPEVVARSFKTTSDSATRLGCPSSLGGRVE